VPPDHAAASLACFFSLPALLLHCSCSSSDDCFNVIQHCSRWRNFKVRPCSNLAQEGWEPTSLLFHSLSLPLRRPLAYPLALAVNYVRNYPHTRSASKQCGRKVVSRQGSSMCRITEASGKTMSVKSHSVRQYYPDRRPHIHPRSPLRHMCFRRRLLLFAQDPRHWRAFPPRSVPLLPHPAAS
jgi:hypothetical protein